MTEIIHYAWGQSSLGRFLAATSDRGLVAVELGDGPRVAALRERFAGAELVEDPAFMADLVLAIAAAIEHPESPSDLAVDLRGSDFELRVWTALREIPAGETVSYGTLATRLGVPGEAREVAAACAANTLAVLVPCHRVVKKDGATAGYRWGYWRKRALIERERRARAHPHAGSLGATTVPKLAAILSRHWFNPAKDRSNI
jgi:AraC family transcriptional regulator of adaptative response/methylated-DNA-[protein]-cysteine methyltransferase